MQRLSVALPALLNRSVCDLLVTERRLLTPILFTYSLVDK